MDAPNEFKSFHNHFMKLIYRHDVSRVFDDFLDYIIHGYTVDNSSTWDKRYSQEENRIFFELYKEYLIVMQDKLVTDKDWYDFFGTYYEAEVVSKLGRKGSGQFFTPPQVCDLMSEMNLAASDKKSGLKVNDPAAGSGRCLLSLHVRTPGCYMVAQDLDLSCVKMCICNFMSHAVKGEVGWMNSLTDEIYDGWMVNRALHKTGGLPHVMKLSKPEIEIREATVIQEQKSVKTDRVTLDAFMGES